MAKATSGFQHCLWHRQAGNDISLTGNMLAFHPFPSLAVDSEGRGRQCGHPTGAKRCKRTPGCRCGIVRGMLLLPNSLCASPEEDAVIPKQAGANGFLWRVERWSLQHSPLFGRRTLCSAPGGSRPFRSVWMSKLFHYLSFARAEVRERSQLCQGVYFQMARNVLVHFPADSCMCCESWRQTQVWPCFC